MNIKIGTKYEISKDRYQFILTENVEGVSKKDKNKIITKKQTYHASLLQIANKIAFDATEDAASLAEHHEQIERLTKQIADTIEHCGVV